MKRFLLLSDIHATDVDPTSSTAPSYVSSFGAATSRKDPIEDLQRLLSETNTQVDYVCCAGDLTNRSSPVGLSYAWQRLNALASALKARLIATVGNHDIDSRYQSNKYDPRGYAMSLLPQLPVPEREQYLEYWAENFTLLKEEACNIIALNTAAFHGGGADVKNEIEHGRISDVTIEKIRLAISAAPAQPINLLLCHHHPLKASAGDPDLVGQTRGGERLIEVLEESDRPWVVIHGHKHAPDLYYGHGGSNAPVVLGCASFSAQVNVDAQNKNPNQVHLLEVDPGAAIASALSIAGQVVSWTWQVGIGWRKSADTQGLAHRTGFGYRGSTEALAAQIDTMLSGDGAPHVEWDRATAAMPLLARLIPPDFRRLERSLKALGIHILSGDSGPAQIGRRS